MGEGKRSERPRTAFLSTLERQPGPTLATGEAPEPNREEKWVALGMVMSHIGRTRDAGSPSWKVVAVVSSFHRRVKSSTSRNWRGRWGRC